MNHYQRKIKFAFWGSSDFSVLLLDKMYQENLIPTVIITTKDKEKGRGLELQENVVKKWAKEKNVKCVDASQDVVLNRFGEFLTTLGIDLNVVASYGKIIKKEPLFAPKYGSVNVHPSLLPLYRGPSPVESQILDDNKNISITLMQMDEEMDHGNIITQENLILEEWPMTCAKIFNKVANQSAKILRKFLEDLEQEKEIKSTPQEHTRATYTRKFEKKDGEVVMSDKNTPEENYKIYLKYCALYSSTGIYYFVEKNGKKIRVKIRELKYDKDNQKITLLRVIPEGKREMTFIELQHYLLQ